MTVSHKALLPSLLLGAGVCFAAAAAVAIADARSSHRVRATVRTVTVTAPPTTPVVPAAPRAVARVHRAPPLATTRGIRSARAYARGRMGTVAFAVLDQQGRMRGLHRTVDFPSASVVKAMLLVARLRALGTARLTDRDRDLLWPMITQSDNDAAIAMHGVVGDDGLQRLAKAAHMRYFATTGALFNTQLAAADQARFFMRIDTLVPPAHRRYARRLLASITPYQRWGIAPVARRHHLQIFFKGGWRTGIVHQEALLQRGRHRIALAIFTSGEPMGYGEQTLAGIATRVLG